MQSKIAAYFILSDNKGTTILTNIAIYFLMPIVVAAFFHFTNPNYKKQNVWGIWNDLGLGLAAVLLILLYYVSDIAPNLAEYLHEGSKGARRGLLFWSFGFILILFPHVIKNRFRHGVPLETNELRKTIWYKLSGVLIVMSTTIMAIRVE